MWGAWVGSSLEQQVGHKGEDLGQERPFFAFLCLSLPLAVGKLLIKVEVYDDQIASGLGAIWETPLVSRVSPSLTLSRNSKPLLSPLPEECQETSISLKDQFPFFRQNLFSSS